MVSDVISTLSATGLVGEEHLWTITSAAELRSKPGYLSNVDLDGGMVLGSDDSVARRASGRKTSSATLQVTSIHTYIRSSNSPFTRDVEVHEFTSVVLHDGFDK